MDSFELSAIALMLIIAFITDVKSQKIPNRLTAGFFAAALVYQIVNGGMGGLYSAAAGAFAGFAPLLLLHLAKGIGAGDVKLFGAIGAWVGVGIVLQMMFYAILYAGLIGVCLLVVNRVFGRKFAAEMTSMLIPASGWRKHQWLQWAKSGKKFPFMLAVAPAAVTVCSLIY